MLNRAIDLDKKCAGAYYNLGTFYLNSNAFDQAEHYFSEAVVLDPLSVASYNNLGIAQFHQNKMELFRATILA